MIFGHLAIAGIAKQSRFRNENWKFLAVAAMGPDLLDKTAGILFGLPRRGMGHSLIVLVAVALIGWLVVSSLKRSQNLLVPGLVMWFSHLAGDFLEWPQLLWPFLGPPEPSPYFGLQEKLYQFYVVRFWPEQFWLEIVCIVVALGLLAVRSSGRKVPSVQRGN